MKRLIIIISSLFMVALVSGSVFAFNNRHGGGDGYGRHGNGFLSWKGLSNIQKDRISELRQKYIDETYEFRSSLMMKNRELDMAMEVSKPDRAKIKRLSKEINDIQSKISDKEVEYRLGVNEIAPGFDSRMKRGHHRRGMMGGGMMDGGMMNKCMNMNK